MTKQKKNNDRSKKRKSINKLKHMWQNFIKFSLLNKILTIFVALLIIILISVTGFFIYNKVTAPPENVTASDMSPIVPPTGYKAIMFKNTSFPLPLNVKENGKEKWRIEEDDIDFLVDRIYFNDESYSNDANDILEYLNNCGFWGITEFEIGGYQSGNRIRYFASKVEALQELKMQIMMNSEVSETDFSEESATYEALYNSINKSSYPLYAQFVIATHDNSKTWDIFMISTHKEESKDLIDEYAHTLLFQYVTGQY